MGSFVVPSFSSVGRGNAFVLYMTAPIGKALDIVWCLPGLRMTRNNPTLSLPFTSQQGVWRHWWFNRIKTRSVVGLSLQQAEGKLSKTMDCYKCWAHVWGGVNLVGRLLYVHWRRRRNAFPSIWCFIEVLLYITLGGLWVLKASRGIWTKRLLEVHGLSFPEQVARLRGSLKYCICCKCVGHSLTAIV